MSHRRPWPYPRALAHRGGGTLAPENTIAALRAGLEHGYRGAEFDAMLARDGVPVLMHDETLERTTSGRGRVDALDSRQLAALDAGGWHSARFRGEPVPTLVSALAFCRAHAIWPNVEIKPAAGSDGRTADAVARVTAAAYADQLGADGEPDDAVRARLPLLSSFSGEALRAARAAAPRLPRGLLVEEVPADWAAQLDGLGCVSLHVDHRRLSADQARAVKDAGYWLFCYTVNDPARVDELRGWGVDAFCTDRIDLIRPTTD